MDYRNIVVAKGENMSAPTILIIDDDPDFVMVTKAILETKQYNVRFAYDPEEGFTKLDEEIPDALILDVMMGKGAEGFVFARKIRKDARFDQMPILMITSMSEQTGFNFPGESKHSRFLPKKAVAECEGKSRLLGSVLIQIKA